MTAAIAATSDRKQRDQAEHDEQAGVGWRQRALNAEDALKTAYAEISARPPAGS